MTEEPEMAMEEPRRRQALARHVIEVVAPSNLDMQRLSQMLMAGFDARSVRCRTSIDLRSSVEPISAKLNKVQRALLDILRDGKPWRSAHLAEQLLAQAGTTRSRARHEIVSLCDLGLVERVRHGVFILAGMEHPSKGAIPPLRKSRKLAPRDQALLQHLDSPKDAATLVASLGVTRQRVDQLLKRLMREGHVVRIQGQGSPLRMVWLRSDVDRGEAIANSWPPLSRARVALLSALAPDAIHWQRDVATQTGQSIIAVSQYIRALAAQGLVIAFRFGQRRYCAITPRGLEHPLRSTSGQAASSSDFAQECSGISLRFLQALSVLGQARTRELSDAIADDDAAPKNLGSGQIVQRLQMRDLVERIGGSREFRSPHATYRLTEAGRFAVSVISRFHTPPTRKELDARIIARRESRATQVRMRLGALEKIASGIFVPLVAAHVRIVRHLQDGGPESTTAIKDLVADHYKDRKSINLVMKTLEERGYVARVGVARSATVWSSTEKSRQALSAVEVPTPALDPEPP